MPEVAEKEKDGWEVKPDAEEVQNVPPQHSEEALQICSPVNERCQGISANHIIIG